MHNRTLKAFEELGVAVPILKVIQEMGYESPMPVQGEAIPFLLGKDNDIIALAQTGTGKTAAYGLPILQKISVSQHQPQALILCPARELCLWIADDLNGYSRYVNSLKVLPIYGGSSIKSQIKALKRGVHVVMVIPKRLINLMNHKTVDLGNVKNVILDEADEMLNMGFTDSISKILAAIPESHNMLLFSTTVPKEIASITKRYMRDPKEIVVGRRNGGNKNICDIYCMVHVQDKYLTLRRLADYYPNIYGIIFCHTHREAQEIVDKSIQDGYNANSLYDELSRTQCDYMMQKFRIRNIQLLVAMDIAARGLDVGDLTHVTNYGLPDEVESYTHCRGRTGRARKTGVAISVCHVRGKGKIREIERIINKKFDKGKVLTGEQICEKQLSNLMGRVEKVRVNEGGIVSSMPSVYRKLEWLNKEDIIEHVVSLEFNRMINYYRGNDGIGVIDESTPREEGKCGGKGEAEEGYTRFFISFGEANELIPPQLIELVSKCVPGKVRISHVDLCDNFSFFEVEEREANRVMDSMNGFEVGGRRISVEPAQAEGEGGKDSRGSRGGSRSGNGFRDRRDSNRKGRDSRRKSDRGDRGDRRSGRGDDEPKRKLYEDTPRGEKKRGK